MITFTVYGKQITQGNKRPMPVHDRHTGTQMIRNGKPVFRVIEGTPALKPWKQEVAGVASQAMGDRPLITGAVKLTILFIIPRPKGHYGTGKNAGVIKATAPPEHIVKPDSLKLGRAIEDALTGIVWKDDSQVVCHLIGKRYGERFETRVTIEEA
jgi:crossover junction endodeoxyribonuclease RusA